MCYDVTYLTKRSIEYARKRTNDPELLKELDEQWQQLISRKQAVYHSNGFEHPHLPVYTNSAPFQLKQCYWGLIPSWVKNAKEARQISHKTLNARSETIFEKPSFRSSAKEKRCLVFIDSFFEHHHTGKGTVPHRVKLKSDEPMVLAGLWNEWRNPETAELVPSVSIITTRANSLMSSIHNNPKLKEARMPALLPTKLQDAWLEGTEKEQLLDLLLPFTDGTMEAHPVRPLRGKNAIGNKPQALEKFAGPEENQSKLF